MSRNSVLLQLFFCLFFFSMAMPVFSQKEDQDTPNADLKTPYDAVFTHLYYLQPVEGQYDPSKAARAFNKSGEEAEELAIKLKQIYDGKGKRVYMSQIPEAPNYKDSTSRKHIYFPFPDDFPEIYLSKNAITGKWRYSRETEREIPNIHKKVFPFGSDLLLNLLPEMGQQRFLGLAVWQYLAILILGALGFFVHFVSSRILGFIIRIIANSRLGKGRFDKKIIKKIARILSYIILAILLITFVPVLQLPIGFNSWLILFLRLAITFLVMLLGLRLVSFFRSYLEALTEMTETTTDEHLLPIIIRIIRVVIMGAAFIHVLSIFEVNVTALVAGLSIGGLAVALAAQETLKNLLGSMMLYADKPFAIGDFVSVGSVSGTVVDIGFRSTRIRTADTSIISVPNGNLMNETINNLGERELRRFNTNIGLAYHTPPALIETFIEGLRAIVMKHPNINKNDHYIYLNNMGASSLDVLFIVYFETDNWSVELRWREEVIFAILRMAERLGVQIAFPSTSVYLETMPEKKALVPEYDTELKEANKRLQAYITEMQARFEQESKEHPVIETPEDEEDPSRSNEEVG